MSVSVYLFHDRRLRYCFCSVCSSLSCVVNPSLLLSHSSMLSGVFFESHVRSFLLTQSQTFVSAQVSTLLRMTLMIVSGKRSRKHSWSWTVSGDDIKKSLILIVRKWSITDCKTAGFLSVFEHGMFSGMIFPLKYVSHDIDSSSPCVYSDVNLPPRHSRSRMKI